MLSAGEILNARYRVERALGKGGMGAVYLATHLELEQQVAIKEMLLGSADPEARAAQEQQFRAEARILNRLRHANLPRVYDFFELDAHHYLVMDFIKGGTLEVLHEHGTLPEGQVLAWTRELCDVLAYLHSNTPPVVFRDLKPSNIMLTEEGSIRLIDFGIAKVFEPESGGGKTLLQGAASHGFAAPEQYGVGGTDARSDIYSLGATVYTLLTGLTPPPSMELAAGITELQSLKSLRPDVSEATVSALEWMMQVHRDMRPPNMGVVQEALGFRTAETGAASLPQQLRSVLREEFHLFFPIPEWQDRGNVLTGILAGLASRSKRLSIFSVVGEPGLGKSRLLRELSARVAEEFEVLPIMHGTATLQDIPFGCILPGIGAWIRQHSADILPLLKDRLYPEALFEVGQVLPEIKSLLKDLPAPPVRDALERSQSISTAICLVLEEAARLGPALLLMDDMQWVDEATLRLLDTIRIGDLASQVAMVLAVEATGPEHACRGFINRWARRGELVPINLPYLSREDMAPYVHAIFPPIEGLDRQLDLLLVRSRGNPLLLEEILRFLVVRRYVVEKNGILALTEFPEDILPGTLEDAVRRRREHLPLETQQLLGKASVAGVRFDLRTALKLTGESTVTLTEALARACETLFVMPGERGVYQFTSSAAREVFYQGLPAAQRSELHHKLAIMEEERSTRTGTVTFAAYHHRMAEQSVATPSGDGHTGATTPQVVIEVLVGDAFEMKEFLDTRPLNPKQLDDALDALSLLLRGARTMGMSVLKGAISQTSVGTALDMIARLVKEAGALGYTQSGERFHVNRQEVPPDKMPYDFKSVLSKHRISGFEFQPGVDADELRSFLDLLMASRETVQGANGWKKALIKHRVRHVVVSELIYVGVTEAELFDPARLRMADEVVVKLARAGKQVTKQQTDHFDLDRIDDMLASGVATGQTEVVQAQLANLRQMLETIRAINVNRLQSGPVSGELTGALAGVNADELQQLIALSESVDVPLKKFMESRLEVLVQALESDDPRRRTLGAIGLLRQGQEARRRLLYYLRTSDHPIGRAAATFVLVRSEDQPAVVLTEEILRTTSSSEAVRRLLDAMRVGGMEWNPSLTALLQSPQADIRQAALQFLRTSDMPSGDKLNLVLDGLNSTELGVVDDIVHFAGDLGDEQAVGPLATLMDKLFSRKTAEGVKVQEHICHALGDLGSPLALPLLKAILIRKGFLVGAWEPSVRAAAVYALSHIPGSEARELLKKQASDTDANVSRTAQFLLAQPENGHQGPALLAALQSDQLSV